jgi:hypothetical protein
MGIDYVIITEDNVYKFLKYDWRDIRWREIFNLINVNLDVIYDNAINFWSTEQIELVYNLLFNLRHKDLQNDIDLLRDLFKGYVDKKSKIIVF